jgi:hypothetical protein
MSVKASEALLAPAVTGVNVTLTVQVLLGSTLAPVQVSALVVKLLALVPLSATLTIARFAAPVFVTVTVCAALVELRGCDEKVRLGGERDAALFEKLPTRLEAFTVPIPVAKSHPVPAA